MTEMCKHQGAYNASSNEARCEKRPGLRIAGRCNPAISCFDPVEGEKPMRCRHEEHEIGFPSGRFRCDLDDVNPWRYGSCGSSVSCFEPAQAPFYVCWVPDKGNPQRRHETQAEAIVEAQRLAKKNREVFVLQMIGVAKSEVNVTWEELR